MGKLHKVFFTIFFGIFFCCSVAGVASAYVIEDLHLKTSGSIIVGPGKAELLLEPGDTYSLEELVSNVSGMTKIIDFTTEDMTASNKPDESLEFLGNVKGPYSLKDYVKPELDQITLLTGQRVRMPVTISIPKDAEPGGLYGALMVSASNIPSSAEVKAGNAAGQINLITRVASLLFIRVKGDALESGFLKDFKTEKSFYEQGPVNLEITSTNTGNVHLDPYGTIEIKDIFGRIIDTRGIDPWFVMPKSERVREMKWNSAFLFGKYTAILTMNRGYGDIIDTKSVAFWIIPWKIVTVGLIVLILIICFFIWIFSHIQWKGKPSNPVSPSNVNSPIAPQNYSAPPSAPLSDAPDIKKSV